MRSLLRRWWPQLTLSSIWLILFILNLKPGQYLSGWDNLQTELNPILGIRRAFFSVWQEYQSFGLVAGLAHGSDLIRSVFVWLLTLVLPQWMVRYTFHFMMLLIGGLGSYVLFLHIFKKKALALFGSIFYMLNLGTAQIFYVPFEPFSIFFAALPWELWIFRNVLEHTSRKNLLLFFLINILATPQSYVQTIFVVYGILLACISAGFFIEHRSLSSFKKILTILILTVLINSFWLMPQLYFLKTSNSEVQSSKINQLSTEDTYFQNYEKGTLPYFAKLEGYYYDLYRTNGDFLFEEWKAHTKMPLVNGIQYLFFLVAVVGLFSKRKRHADFVIMFGLCATVLLVATPGFEQINELIRKNSFINQIFRSPFTKYIVPYSLVFSYLLVSGLNAISGVMKPLANRKGALILSVLLFIYVLPAFRGFAFSPSMFVNYPTEYFQVMDYFKTIDKNKRIALLPDHTFWGWFYNRWGYNGSGFLWYGIEQSIVSRTFDPWSNKSESYFWEMKTAAEAENVEQFEAVIEKYNIDYLLLDKSLLPVSATLRGLQYDRYLSIFAKSKKFHLVQHSKNIDLYEVRHSKTIKNFVSISSKLPNIGPKTIVMNNDVAYRDNGDYMTDEGIVYDKYYPFIDLMTQTQIRNKPWSISETNDNFVLTTSFALPEDRYSLSTTSLSENVSIYNNQLIDKTTVLRAIKRTGDSISVTVPKQLIYRFQPTNTTYADCGNIPGRTTCFAYSAPFLEQRYGYLVMIANDNSQGRRLFFYTLDNTKRQSFVEDRLQHDTEIDLISPKYKYGLGYTFVFHNNSYENTKSVNSVKDLAVYLFPYEQIQNLAFSDGGRNTTTQSSFSSDFSSHKSNYYTYNVVVPSTHKNSLLILNQSFHPGWIAIMVTGYRLQVLKNHVLVNNWENGWALPERSDQATSYTILFWPQYLQYSGFILLLATGMWLWKKQA